MAAAGPGRRAVSRASQSDPARERIAQGFTKVEDVLYVGLGVVLAVGGVALLVNAVIHFVRSLLGGAIGPSVVAVLDQLLLILMIIEVLYTVQVSFREHVLVPEPFVLVALIAGVRRILVITAEFGTLASQGESAFRYAMIELGLLTAMTGGAAPSCWCVTGATTRWRPCPTRPSATISAPPP